MEQSTCPPLCFLVCPCRMQKSDQELDTAYQEIAQLQQQLADQQQVQQQQLHHMQQAFNRLEVVVDEAAAPTVT